jgi:hypothetical protein
MKSFLSSFAPPAISHPRSTGLSAVLAGCLLVLTPRGARAENSASYHYEDYNEADGRIAVKTQSALLEQDIGTDMHVKVQGVIDAIAGATPNGQPAPAGSDQVVLTTMHERRKAWNADFTRQLATVNLDFGVANSREGKYTSTALSLNTQADFNEKNTTLLVGIAGTDDRVKVFYQTPWAKKRTEDFIVGLRQLLDLNTSVSLDFSWGRATGALTDPYKLVQKTVQVAPGVFLPFTYGENRPDHRTKWTVLASVNHAYPEVKGALDASYRFYHDTYGIDAHTLELAWLQHVGGKLVLKPGFRFYAQSAASFYYYQLDQTNIVPVSGTPNPQGPFFSSDYRLSDLHSYAYGLKAVLTATAHWRVELGYDRYDMRGRDGRTPASAYPRANVVTGGATFSW